MQKESSRAQMVLEDKNRLLKESRTAESAL